MKNPFLLAVLSLTIALFAAGCGDDSDEDTGGGGGGAQTTEQPADTGGGGGAEAPAKATVQVTMSDIEFQPSDVTVKKGGKVVWTNEESVPHDVTKTGGPGKDFSSGKGNMNEGDTYEQTFTAAGEVEYVCTVHPNMTGTVTVE